MIFIVLLIFQTSNNVTLPDSLRLNLETVWNFKYFENIIYIYRKTKQDSIIYNT